MKTNLFLIVILIGLISVIIAFQTSCKKTEEESDKFSTQEQSIITTAETFLIDDFIENLKTELISHREDVNYFEFLDTLETTGFKLKSAIENVTTLDDFKSKLEKFYNDFNSRNVDSLKNGNVNNSIDCILLKAGLGYGKGSSIEVGASGTIAVVIMGGLEAQSGGAIETVYDFVTMERKIFISSVCSAGVQVGIGLEAGLSAGVGFTGYNDWIFGFKPYGDKINTMEGPGKGAEVEIFSNLKFKLGIDVGVSCGTWTDVASGCDGLVNILDCPQTILTAEADELHGITFALSGTPSAGPAVGLVAGVSGMLTGNCTTGINESYTNFDSNRKTASWKMVMEILNPMPFPGIFTMLSGFDVIAACAALTYGNSNLNDCNSIIPGEGLVAYYPFNGNANDVSGNGNNGALIGDSKFLDGKIGQSLYLDGDGDYVELGTGLNFTNDYSVSVWIKSECNSRRYPGIFAKYETNLYGSYDFDLHYGKIDFWISNGFGGYINIYSDITVQENKFEFVTWVVKDNYLNMYLNTQKVKEGSVPQITQNNDKVTIGRQFFMFQPYSDLEYKGYIDELRVYNKALSEAEIIQLYNNK